MCKKCVAYRKTMVDIEARLDTATCDCPADGQCLPGSCNPSPVYYAIAAEWRAAHKAARNDACAASRRMQSQLGQIINKM